jgi:hypothetical protein
MRFMKAPTPAPAGHSLTRPILWIVLLALPALIPLGSALITPYLNNRIPTGFVRYDMPYYVANGRAYFDHGFHLTYGNPYAGYNSPAVYFQPHILLLGLMQQLGLDPGITFNCFGILTLLLGSTAAVWFYAEAVGTETTAKRIGLICFFWGGGVLTLAGLARGLVKGHLLSSMWIYDTGGGWWMLNFGRNLVYPMEAYYHALFLLSLLALIQARLILCLVFAALLSFSHPFTGLTLICILMGYSAIELMLRSGVVTLRFLFAVILIAVLHLAYYGIWLNRFSDHRILQSQWQVAWYIYRPSTFIPALLIVGCLGSCRLAGSRFQCFRDSRIRLFAVWFFVVFALTQHDLLIHPSFQPIHFAHGYDWMALFFIGAAPLIAILDRALKISAPWVRGPALAAFLVLFLLDNSAWLAKQAIQNDAISLTKAQSDILHWLGQNAKSGDMIVSQDGLLSYLVSTYTPARSWQGHVFNTPSFDQRHDEVERFFDEGRIQPAWKMQKVFYVSPSLWLPPGQLSLEPRYRNSEYSIWTSSQ